MYCINVLTVGDGGHPTVLNIRCHLLRQVHVPDRSADLRRGRLPPAILAELVPLPRSRACHLPEDNRLYSLIENPLTKLLLVLSLCSLKTVCVLVPTIVIFVKKQINKRLNCT